MSVNSPQKNQYFWSFKRISPTAFIACLVIILVIFTLSKTAYAGLFSSLWNMVGNQQASAQTEKPSPSKFLNSQKYPLPTYSANTNPLAYAKSASSSVPIYDGSTLSAEMAAETGASSAEHYNTQISVYTVRSGDTISSVAKMFNVSVNTILWANDLTSKSYLQQGQVLVILPVTGITYIIKKGDTIQTIAKKYSADVEDILNYNDLTLSSPLTIGDKLILPDGEFAVPVVASSPASAAKKVVVGNEPLLDNVKGLPLLAGYFVCPLPGSRVSQGLHGHNGVDLATGRGTPLHAAAAGTVIIARASGAWNGGYGNFVVISHPNGTQTLYAHMQKVSVSVGQTVNQNEIIGSVGMTGLTTGPHVHFEVRGAKNTFSDPSACK